jgi:hypothetical protein
MFSNPHLLPKMGRNIYVLQLQEDGSPPYGGTGISLPLGSVLRFVLQAGTRLCSLSPKLFTNVPMDEKSHFDRNRFHEVEWYAKLTDTNKLLFFSSSVDVLLVFLGCEPCLTPEYPNLG